MTRTPDLATVRDAIAWSYANLACAHSALKAERIKHAQIDWMIRAKLYRGIRMGTMKMGDLFDDERLKLTAQPTCAYCGTDGPLAIDHLIPRASGGGDRENNLVRACRSCNSSKGKSDLLAWFAHRQQFPPLMLLRRYLKIVFAECGASQLLDCELVDPRLKDLPFDLQHLPREFPALANLKL